MEDIQSQRGTIEPKIAAVTIDVNLLRAELRKVMDKVTTAESHINGLQEVAKRLENQVEPDTPLDEEKDPRKNNKNGAT
ncbi:hypothetical protein NDU88_002095 [Pleurodeles waltl]|uniref:Uncharacterized protein n=1 Tax=Pleurodeles waltl TaxID=8319 RepID=A0AAV7UXY0_PLEWA|nr:hypothetical protein NDU88_002095 [Pleurodeles waltl]